MLATLTKEFAVSEIDTAPAVTGFHHFSPTVSDVEASAQWYERVFAMNRVPVTFPHYGAEQEGYAVLLMDPRSGIAIGLHHHQANTGQPFDERRTGLDHISFGVASRADLDGWASWLDELGIEHSGVIDTDSPMPYSVVVFRDPDNIQLELFHMAG
jgi:glyoxylase I family protein